MRQDVLLFIDNIFRFVQAGSEVSALLGRMPSAVGYQPTLATEMGALQERITSTQARRRSPRCRPSTCRPTTSPTRRRPRRSRTWTPRSCSTASIVEMGIYPAVDPLARPRASSTPDVVGQEHYDVAREVQRILQRYRELQDIITILGVEELPEADREIVAARAPHPALPFAAQLRGRAVHRHPRASTCRSTRPSRGFREIIEGRHDEVPEQAFMMAGSIDDVLEKAKRWASHGDTASKSEIRRTSATNTFPPAKIVTPCPGIRAAGRSSRGRAGPRRPADVLAHARAGMVCRLRQGAVRIVVVRGGILRTGRIDEGDMIVESGRVTDSWPATGQSQTGQPTVTQQADQDAR